MKKNILVTMLSLSLVLVLSGCSNRKNYSPVPSISSEAQAELKKPINCNTAQSDLALLEQEKASVGKRIISGVRSVFPIAAVAGILTGDYSDRVSVASGQYNADIDAKIKEIHSECGI